MKRSDFLKGNIKAEFGNLEQIKMIQEIEQSDKAFKSGFMPDIVTTHKIQELCHCHETTLEFEADGEDPDCLIGEVSECRKCKRKYAIRSQSGFIVIMYY